MACSEVPDVRLLMFLLSLGHWLICDKVEPDRRRPAPAPRHYVYYNDRLLGIQFAAMLTSYSPRDCEHCSNFHCASSRRFSPIFEREYHSAPLARVENCNYEP